MCVPRQIKKRHIYYASELIRELIKSNDVETLRIINCGVKVLTLSDAKEKPTDYRLCSEGIKVVYPVRRPASCVPCSTRVTCTTRTTPCLVGWLCHAARASRVPRAPRLAW